jgi:hypothetical protein
MPLIPVSLLSTREEIHLSTNFVYPPIPSRNFDWSCIDDNTYDASYEGEDENGHHWRSSPSGHGATEQAAIADLLEQLEERQ